MFSNKTINYIMAFTNDNISDNYSTDAKGWEVIKEYIPKDDTILWAPSYSKMKEISIRLKELDKPFILILPTRYFGIKFFMDKFKDHLQIIIPNKRPTFTHLTDPKEGYTPPMGTYYFCYKMNLPKDLIFL